MTQVSFRKPSSGSAARRTMTAIRNPYPRSSLFGETGVMDSGFAGQPKPAPRNDAESYSAASARGSANAGMTSAANNSIERSDSATVMPPNANHDSM
jgi:hypothetical protein